MIGFIAPYTFTQFGTTGHYSAIAILHTFQFTVTHALGFSIVTSRILATDLSQSHCLRGTVWPFLNQLRLPSPELDPILFPTTVPATLLLLLLSCQTLLITTLHGPHGKYRLLLTRMRVYWSVT
jgi:hypothetical protein